MKTPSLETLKEREKMLKSELDNATSEARKQELFEWLKDTWEMIDYLESH